MNDPSLVVEVLMQYLEVRDVIAFTLVNVAFAASMSNSLWEQYITLRRAHVANFEERRISYLRAQNEQLKDKARTQGYATVRNSEPILLPLLAELPRGDPRRADAKAYVRHAYETMQWQCGSYDMTSVGTFWCSSGISKFGTRIVTGHGSRSGGEGAAVVWKYTAQPKGKAPTFEVVEKYTGHERHVSCIHQSEFITITGGKHIEIHRSPISHYDSNWNAKPAQLMHQIKFVGYQQLFDMGVHENNMITIGNDQCLRLFDISNGKTIFELGKIGQPSVWADWERGVAFLPVSHGMDLNIVDINSGKKIRTVEGSIMFSGEPDSTLPSLNWVRGDKKLDVLYTAMSRGSLGIRSWDIPMLLSGENLEAVAKAGQNFITRVPNCSEFLVLDDVLIMSRNFDSDILIVDRQTGELLRTMKREYHSGGVASYVYDKKERSLFTSGGSDGFFCVYNFDPMKLIGAEGYTETQAVEQSLTRLTLKS